ncbi:hypothetical protein [Dyella telluris]|uniref:Uncharacterized protein n=1 Tax=Dyella telluris TaxID=2763498 RepID=A0A7G8Q0M2_9GAMM|nr:hypothetical protein [Dyella telluris]QNK00330.1 hypothetical protein H8F01_14565 [Dyella telluris]
MITKTLLVLTIALGIVPVAMAQQNPAAGTTDPASQPQVSAQKDPSQSPLKPGDRNCLQTTGSLIPAKQGTCLSVMGRSYSQQDIKNTGSPTLGPALEQLDPSITVRGH